MVDKQRVINLLTQMIQHRENDLAMDVSDGKATVETMEHFTNLIIAVTRYLHDIRYCSKSDCPCSPEMAIKRHYESIYGYLAANGPYALTPIPLGVIEDILKGDKDNESK